MRSSFCYHMRIFFVFFLINIVLLQISTQWNEYFNISTWKYQHNFIDIFHALYWKFFMHLLTYENKNNNYQISLSEHRQNICNWDLVRILIKLPLILYIFCKNNLNRESYISLKVWDDFEEIESTPSSRLRWHIT